MSLILETLKKLRKENKKAEDTNLPPALLDKQNTKENISFFDKNKRILILTGLLLVMGILVLAVSQYLEYLYPKGNNVISYSEHNTVRTYETKETELKTKTIKNAPEDSVGEKKTPSNKENSNNNKIAVNNKIDKTTNKVRTDKVKTVSKLPPPILPKHKSKQDNKVSKKEIWKHINTANEYIKYGDLEKAIKEYEFVVQYKKDERIFNNLIYLYVRTDKIDNINKIIEKYKLFKNEKILIKTVAYLIKAKKFEFAEKFIERYGQYTKEYIYFYIRGLYYEGTGYLNKALKFYKMAYEKNPFNDLIAYSYGRLLDIEGKFDKALSVYKMLYKNTKNSKLKKIVKDRINKLEVWKNE